MNIRNQTINLIIIYGIVGICIIISFLVRIVFIDFNKLLKKQIPFLYFKLFGIFNFWSISHLIMYIFLGFFAPKIWYISLALSVLWESFEYVSEKKKIRFIKYKTSDFFTNIIGLVIGITIYDLVNYIKTKNKKKHLKISQEKEEKEDTQNPQNPQDMQNPQNKQNINELKNK